MPTTQETQKIIQYLNEAQATELALVRTLQAHLSITPSGRYKNGLESHLNDTREHAERIARRLDDLGAGRNPVAVGVGVVQGVLAQVLALSKGPIDLVRGGSPEEKLLKNAKDECATEALEIATYDSLEALARRVGDDETVKLAVRHRADEEKMLTLLRREIPRLTEAVVDAEIDGDSSYDPSTTGAADTVRETGSAVRGAARKASTRAKTSARQARKVPGVAQVEGEVKGALASEEDLAIDRYGKLKASEVVAKLSELSQVDLAKVDAFERKNQNRRTVVDKISSLRGDEPWPGYDDQTVENITTALDAADDDTQRKVREYEQRHKGRSGVLQATERELAEKS